MSQAFRLTRRALADVEGIGRYTRDRWGMAQARRYLGRLDETFHALAQSQGLGRDRSDVRPGLLSCPAGRHVIFFRRAPQGDVEILRILHDSMDFQRHL